MDTSIFLLIAGSVQVGTLHVGPSVKESWPDTGTLGEQMLQIVFMYVSIDVRSVKSSERRKVGMRAQRPHDF